MPYDEGIAQRAREALDDLCDTKTHKIVEKKVCSGGRIVTEPCTCEAPQ